MSKSSRSFFLALQVLLLLGLFLTPARGQDLTMVWEFTPKPDAMASFESVLKAHMEFRQEQGDPWSWGIGQVAVGEKVGTYYALSGGHSWADFDAYNNSAFTKLADSHWAASVQPLLETTASWISVDMPELSRLPAEPMAPTLYEVTAFYLNPGGEFAFNEGIGKVLQAASDADAPMYWSASTPRVGMEGPVIFIMGMSEDWAGLADPDPNMEELLMEAYGEDGAMEIFQQFADAYHHYTSFIVVARPDLSIGM
jgi:hypothetical protein